MVCFFSSDYSWHNKSEYGLDMPQSQIRYQPMIREEGTLENKQRQTNRDMRFSTMWYVRQHLRHFDIGQLEQEQISKHQVQRLSGEKF